MAVEVTQNLPNLLEMMETPCFLMDISKVKNNCKVMTDRCSRIGVQLRPHMKTAKSIEAGLLATGGSKRRICVSTLKEAEFYADTGFDDILFAMLFACDKIPRLISLAGRLDAIHVVIDNPVTLKLLEDNPIPDKKWSAYLIIDTGSGREGSLWSEKSTIDLGYKMAASQSVCLRGLYTHEGVASYSVRGKNNVSGVANTTVDRILHVKQRLLEKGVECNEVSIGSTPTASLPGDKVKDITELHPGNFVFYDAQQHEIGACNVDDIACMVATRVIGQYPLHHGLLIDAGWSALSLDGKLSNGSYGLFKGFPNLCLEKMHQEYGFVKYDPEYHSPEDFPIGTMLHFFPYHSCATALLHHRHLVLKDGKIIDLWKPCSQW